MLLAIALPRPLAFLAKEELFHPAPWGWALRVAGIIPVRRGRADRHALELSLGVLRDGGALAVFAEGTRSADGRLRRAEPGVGTLAARSGAPVLPVALIGTERLRSLRGWLSRPRLVARCGAVWQPAVAAQGGSAAYRQLADGMMARVAALMPESRRGIYGSGQFTEPAVDSTTLTP
jgi:1-acyl-sn-glycerol-3-phosphate acyltransferase